MYRTPADVRRPSDCATNSARDFVGEDTASSLAPLTKHELFGRARFAIVRCATEATAPGIVVCALDLFTGRVYGERLLTVAYGRPTALVLGRHSRADVLLPECSTLSLRHMLVLAHPHLSAAYRVLDLRSASDGFVDDNHRTHRALLGTGGLFLRMARAAVFLLPIKPGDARDIAHASVDALFPQPAYIEQDAPSGVIDRRRLERQDGGTVVSSVAGPDWCGRTPGGFARLAITTSDRRITIELDRDALVRGVLLGNYPRCDTGYLDHTVSRVHALVQLIGGVPHVIDTASTNGTQMPRAESGVAALDPRASFTLANAARVEWLQR